MPTPTADSRRVIIASPRRGSPRRSRVARRTRRGSVMALMAFLLPVLAILAAFCINAAHMQLTRTELIVATDAAARAGGRAFSELQTVDAAKNAAMVTAALNNVGGQPLQLQTDDAAGEIEFGISTQPNGINGRYAFQPVPTAQVAAGQSPASSVRVNGRRTIDSLGGAVPLVFPQTFTMTQFEPVHESVAMQVDRDISLVIDRSGSMGWYYFQWPQDVNPWDATTMNAGVAAGILVQSGNQYAYASGHNSDTYQKWAWETVFDLGPKKTPWEELEDAVDAFLNVLDTTPQQEQVGLASYATTATRDTWLTKNFNSVRNKVGTLSPDGMTAIGLGMQRGIAHFNNNRARPFASKTMVVMTDGVHNTGITPLEVAQAFAGTYNLTVHTVTFGGGADQNMMRQVAQTCNGKHYHAADGQQLIQVFQEIANNLPTLLTK